MSVTRHKAASGKGEPATNAVRSPREDGGKWGQQGWGIGSFVEQMTLNASNVILWDCDALRWVPVSGRTGAVHRKAFMGGSSLNGRLGEHCERQVSSRHRVLVWPRREKLTSLTPNTSLERPINTGEGRRRTVACTHPPPHHPIHAASSCSPLSPLASEFVSVMIMRGARVPVDGRWGRGCSTCRLRLAGARCRIWLAAP